jgi:hypothetical protein
VRGSLFASGHGKSSFLTEYRGASGKGQRAASALVFFLLDTLGGAGCNPVLSAERLDAIGLADRSEERTAHRREERLMQWNDRGDPWDAPLPVARDDDEEDFGDDEEDLDDDLDEDDDWDDDDDEDWDDDDDDEDDEDWDDDDDDWDDDEDLDGDEDVEDFLDDPR